MAFEADLLAIDPALAREFEVALGEARARLRRLDSAQSLVDAASAESPTRVVVAIDDAAKLDPAWWRSVQQRAPHARLLIASRTCDDETWRRWLLLGAVAVVRPPFDTLDLEILFAGEPAVSQMFRRQAEVAALGKAMFRYSVPSDPQYIPGIVHVVALLAMEFGWSVADWATNLPLALDEALSNAIKHGNRRDPKKRVEVEGQVDSAFVRIKVRDEGAGFARDPNHDPVDPANLLAPSGRGLFLIESVMDEVRYTQDGRCIEMVKRASAAAASATAAAPKR
jgi:anti-sigma regulatory factor (Ser/Thr protein kinase)